MRDGISGRGYSILSVFSSSITKNHLSISYVDNRKQIAIGVFFRFTDQGMLDNFAPAIVVSRG